MAHGTRRARKRNWKYLTRTVYDTSSPSTLAPPSVIIKRYVTCSVQTENEMAHANKKPFDLYELESLQRITNMPIVESGLNYAENIYRKIKTSNNLVHWTLGCAEDSFQTVVDVATPAIVLFKGPITSIDKLVCKSLDIVEHTVPSINLPPEMIYYNTKQYVTDVGTKIARPVLKRADSVKKISNTVLASKYTVFAADRLDGALNVAEKYVDKYLPACDDQTVDEVDTPIDGPTGKAIHTIHHADRLSRKLKRRLTQRTIAEVKALKVQSAEAVHVLIYVAELVATDPVLAFQKGKELWANLSKDEPENQARPENLEQLLVLLTRESTRKMVHLINFSSSLLGRVSRRVSHSVTGNVRKMLNIADSMVKTIHLEGAQKSIAANLKVHARHYIIVLKEVNIHITNYLLFAKQDWKVMLYWISWKFASDSSKDTFLEQLQQSLATQETSKSALSIPQINIQSSKAIRNSKKNSNGVDNNL